MSNFSSLKTAVQNAIKANGNQEITGNLLQGILLSIVETLGDSAINTLETGLSSEASTRGNADTTLQTNINNEATARQNADSQLQTNINNEATARQNADTQLNNLITGIKNNIDNGYVYAGIATPSTTPVSGKVFYIATKAGTYTNLGGLSVTEGITILKYNGTTWSKEQVTYGDGGVYDVTVQNSGATFASLEALLGSDSLSTLIPTDVRKGGMSIKFVRTSDNKYVQWRYMSSSTAVADFTNVANWQGVDEVPTNGSKNLIESDAVYNLQRQIYNIVGGTVVIDPSKIEPARGIIDGNGNWAIGNGYHVVIEVQPNTSYTIVGGNYTANSLAGFLVSYNPVQGAQSYMQERTNVLPNSSVTITSHNNSLYLYLLVKVNPSSVRTPKSVSFPVTGEMENTVLYTAQTKTDAQKSTARQNIGAAEATVVNNLVAAGYLYAGIAVPNTNPGTPAGKCFYIAKEEGIYTNFNAIELTAGINILKWNGTAWSVERFIGIDDEPTAGSKNLVESGSVYNLQRQIYDIAGGTVIIDPSTIEPARGIIDGNGNWVSGTGYHVVIEVMPNTSYTIVGGNHTANSLAGFLVNYNPTPGQQSYMQKRTNILPNTSYTITSESNSRYLYLLVKIDPSSDRTPASVSYSVTGEIENIQGQIGTLEENVEEVEEKVSENINIEFEQGSLVDATGTETPSNNYIRSGFINIDSIYYIKADSDAYVKLFKYDKNKTPIVSGGQAYSAIGDASEGYYFDINESASYYRLAIRKTDSSAVTPSYDFGIEIRNAKKYLSMLYHRDYDRDIVNIIEEQRPVISMCLQSTVGEGTYKTDFKLIDVTDLHGNFSALKDAISIRNISQIADSIIICTGDNVHDTAKYGGNIVPAFTEYMGLVQDVGVYHCCGQHEVGFPNGDNGRRKDRTLSTQEVFDNYISPMKTAWGLPNLDTVYYYKDFASSKIRLISLYQYDQPMITDPQDSSLWKYPRNIVWYSQAQLDWLVSTLASTPQGYGVVILMHQPDNTIVRAKETPFFDATRQSISGGDYYIDGCPVRDIVDAFINKTTLTRTYTMTRSEYPASDFTASVNADFTSAVGFFCNFFTGDSHIDTIGKHQDSNQLVLGITSSGQSYDNAIFSKNGRYNQTTKGKGLNINSTLMTIVGYDLTRKELRVGRLGQQYAMTGQKRETDVFKFNVSQ